MRVLLRRGGWLALGALWLAGSASAVPFQETAPPDGGGSAEGSSRKLWDRDREALHPADPLDVVGREERDNGFRERTPALLASDREIARVDRDELRRRRLAMYGGGVSYHEPPPVLDRVPAGGVRARDGEGALAPSPSAAEPEAVSAGVWWWSALAAVLTALFVGSRLRRRAAA